MVDAHSLQAIHLTDNLLSEEGTAKIKKIFKISSDKPQKNQLRLFRHEDSIEVNTLSRTDSKQYLHSVLGQLRKAKRDGVSTYVTTGGGRNRHA